MRQAKIIKESPLQLIHSNPVDDGYCPELTPEENSILDNLATIISNQLLNSQRNGIK